MASLPELHNVSVPPGESVVKISYRSGKEISVVVVLVLAIVFIFLLLSTGLRNMIGVAKKRTPT